MPELVTWKCKDGREVAVRDMTDDHLINTIRFCEKLAERRADTATRNDNSYYTSAEEAIITEPEWCLPPQYETMVAVAKGRGLRV